MLCSPNSPATKRLLSRMAQTYARLTHGSRSEKSEKASLEPAGCEGCGRSSSCKPSRASLRCSTPEINLHHSEGRDQRGINHRAMRSLRLVPDPNQSVRWTGGTWMVTAWVARWRRSVAPSGCDHHRLLDDRHAVNHMALALLDELLLHGVSSVPGRGGHDGSHRSQIDVLPQELGGRSELERCGRHGGRDVL